MIDECRFVRWKEGAKGGKWGEHIPKCVYPQNIHKILGRHIRKQGMRTRDPRVGEDDIQPAVFLDGIIHHSLDGCFVRGVELPRVDLTLRIQGLDFLLVVFEEFVVKVADVDCFGAVLGVLVGCGSAYS